jgi:hypothetical protein
LRRLIDAQQTAKATKVKARTCADKLSRSLLQCYIHQGNCLSSTEELLSLCFLFLPSAVSTVFRLITVEWPYGWEKLALLGFRVNITIISSRTAVNLCSIVQKIEEKLIALDHYCSGRISAIFVDMLSQSSPV